MIEQYQLFIRFLGLKQQQQLEERSWNQSLKGEEKR